MDNLNHIHELFVQAGGSWNHADLTTIIPSYVQYLGTGNAWEEGRSKHLVYPDGGQVVEAHVEVGGRWGTRNLSLEVPGLVPPRTYPGFGSFTGGGSFTSYGWLAGHSQQVSYVGTDGHIHELFSGLDGVWRRADLTLLTGAPAPSSIRQNSFITGYGWEEGSAKQVLYFDDSGAIHELTCGAGSSWNWANLTALTGAPSVSPSRYNRMVGYAWPDGRTKQVVYVGNDRHVYEMWCGVASTWSFGDLTAITGAPNAHPTINSFSAHAWREGGTKQVAYVGADRHIYELFVGPDGVWRFADLTAITSSPPV